MRESRFVAQNKQKWEQMEEAHKKGNLSPESIKEQFFQITDDLSFSRTFYKNRSVRVYLNTLAQQVYNKLYTSKGNFLQKFAKFWTEELPLLAFQTRKEFLLCFVLFLLSLSIGFLSSYKDAEFPRQIFGDSYVDMTLENIKNNDPMGVYKQSNPFDMFVYIAINNIRVSFLLFVAGLLFSAGSLSIMFYNGIMLGTFMYFFYSRGLSSEFNLTVWMHGALEICSIVLVTASGVVLGKGLLIPGTLSRFKSFSLSAKRGALLLLGFMPVILLAAFVEGYITRFTELSPVLRATFIGLSFVFILAYFVVYPYFKFSKKKIESDIHTVSEYENLTAENDILILENELNSNGTIFQNTIRVLRKTAGVWLTKVIFAAFIITTIFYFTDKELLWDTFFVIQNDASGLVQQFLTSYGLTIRNLPQFFNHEESFLFWAVQSVFVSFVIWLSFKLINTSINNKIGLSRVGMLLGFLPIWTVNALLLVDIEMITFLYLMFLPFATLLTVNMWLQKGNVLLAIHYSLKHYSNGFFRLYGILGISVLTLFIVFLLVFSPFTWLFIEVNNLGLDISEATYLDVVTYFFITIYFFVIGVFFLLLLISSIQFCFTVENISEAKDLKQKIGLLGTQRKAFGFETE